MVGRVNEITKETTDQWDIFFVEKEKQEELKIPKPFKESPEKIDVATEPPAGNIGIENIGIGEQQQTKESNDPPDTGKEETTNVHTDTSTEPPTTTGTKKPTESLTVDSTEANTEKPTVDTTMKSSEAQTEKPLEQ
ncbi:uncharacterized protein LOC131873933 [Cryptomeria japonica]|uniref:uncharacterized protein LOC131873933 n=1 Tax=Cryptomeria japonica TaxID=3369 RepID=UPI0027DA3B86|nr:uncharacterized protein LOC131873933 [Cryptomeria japonica]